MEFLTEPSCLASAFSNNYIVYGIALIILVIGYFAYTYINQYSTSTSDINKLCQTTTYNEHSKHYDDNCEN